MINNHPPWWARLKLLFKFPLSIFLFTVINTDNKGSLKLVHAMSPQDITLCLFFLLSLGLAVSPASAREPSVLFIQCYGIKFPPSVSNLDLVLNGMLDSSSESNFNTFKSSPLEENNAIYGLYQCRGDLTSAKCHRCVANAISQLKTACAMCPGGHLQLEGCLVKYDTKSFIGAPDKTEIYRRCGPTSTIAYSSEHRDGALGNLVSGDKREYFRRGDFGGIQGTYQCVQDLSSNDCGDCLAEASNRLRLECASSSRGDIYLSKCFIGYADSDAVKDNNGSNNNIGVLIVVVIALLVTILGVGIGMTCKSKDSCNSCNTNKVISLVAIS
ncbi:hypothetical protein SSX86_031590 [Deinandra increscens subsp. villosa]|uniref:Gnk2-homologous domain-containing protein n=1 Tax=Deinandra increscens subsp. villosa TaxID=3103831 RepID=A0AAP0GIR6_9ASTR